MEVGTNDCPTARTTPATPSAESFAAQNAKRQAERIARELREAAARVEDIATRFDTSRRSDSYTYGSDAGDVVQAVMNLLPVAGFGQLATHAGEADRARAQGL